MAKFGKKYRNNQIEEWKEHYINYKLLKHKIKIIKQKILSEPRDNTLNLASKNRYMNSLSVIPITKRRTSLLLDDISILYLRKYGQDLKEFIELLDNELNKCYLFYIQIENELYKNVNSHLYTQTNYINYNIFDIYQEICKLNKTVYFINCINDFLDSNMKALKNILKKFDSKLSTFCGKIQTKYIIHQLTLPENNKLEYLLQYKIIDEATTICESTLKELMKYYNQFQNGDINSRKITIDFDNIKNDDKNENFINNDIIKDNNNNLIDDDIKKNDLLNNIKTKINEKKKGIFKYLKDIDELTYFKIQYGDWFYYLKEENDKLTKHSQRLLENDIFNPILSSPYKNDNIVMKFLSKKDGGNEIYRAQKTMSLLNKINIIFLIIHSFFYNTLVTCIYPLLFIYIKHKNNEHIYSFLTIVFTYFSSFFFMIIYHNTNINNIKITNNISYILLFIGSLSYILSIEYLEDITKDYIIFSCILGSRIFIGLGNNIMMGKKYITLFSPRFYIAKISQYFIIFQILGMAFGPFIGCFLLYIPKTKILYLEYNHYNCIGWYGCIFSFIFFFFNCLLFTGPGNSNFFIIRKESKIISSNENLFEGDLEDSQDKEFYKIQMEIKSKKQNDLNTSTNENDLSIISENSSLNERPEEKIVVPFQSRFSTKISQKNLTVFNDLGNKVKKIKIKRKTSLSKNDYDIIIENNEEKGNNENPLLITVQREMNYNKNTGEYINGEFNRINMIPRTIDDIIRKEKTSFGYINHNLIIMFLLLFFNNMIKENYIAFFSYYITDKESFIQNDETETEEYILDLKKLKFICILTGCVYLSELFSIFFIIPFHKINSLFQKYLVLLMIITNILMMCLSVCIYFDINYPYFPLIFLLILINMIIEVISSSYLSYLIPPEWKFSRIRAGALTVYIMIFGKITGVLFCLISFKDSTWNYFGITVVVFLSYTFISIYLSKSNNMRIKPICRIMQYKKLTEHLF